MEAKNKRFTGKMVLLEYSYFKDVDGRVYDVDINDRKASKTLNRFMREQDIRGELCIATSFEGFVEDKKNENGRPVVNLVKAHYFRRVRC